MPAYRCYPIKPSGSIAGPAQVTDCVDDATAIEAARELLPDQAFEVWQGARRVYAGSMNAEHAHERWFASQERTALSRELVAMSAIDESLELSRSTRRD